MSIATYTVLIIDTNSDRRTQHFSKIILILVSVNRSKNYITVLNLDSYSYKCI